MIWVPTRAGFVWVGFLFTDVRWRTDETPTPPTKGRRDGHPREGISETSERGVNRPARKSGHSLVTFVT